mmetsp:Transcript_24671/g.50018  ORF Transcript_24671/g.50018 Transcript_24671/m.50018 type:complete len:275 (-) Transcript_24671:1833-2657(-)
MAVLQNENKEKGERIEELIAENTRLSAAAAAEKSEDESAKTTTPNDSHRELEDLRAQNKTLSEHNTTMEKKFQYLSEAVDSISLVTTQNMSIERKLLDEIVELKAITAELNAENEDLMAENQQLIELLSERDAELARIRDNPRTPIGYTAESDDDDEDDDRLVMMGSNATSLLDLLARKYCESGVLAPGDEIVVASENHLAHVHPWLRAAETSGCQVKWWTLTDTNETHHYENNSKINVSTLSSPSESLMLFQLVTDQTRVIAVFHASNIIGCV